MNLSSGSFFNISQNSIKAVLLIEFLLKSNFFIVLLYIPSLFLLLSEFAISISPLYTILF